MDPKKKSGARKTEEDLGGEKEEEETEERGGGSTVGIRNTLELMLASKVRPNAIMLDSP